MAFAWLGLIWLVVPIAIGYLGIRAVWVSVTLPHRVPREAACGRCAYPVAGLATPTCPECGSDFRNVGLSTPGFVMRWRGGYTSAIVGWTLVMLMSGMIVTSIVSMLMVTRTMSAVQNSTTTTSSTLRPGSGAYQSFRVDATQSFGSGGTTITVTVVLTSNDGSQSTLELDPATQTYTVDDGAAPGSVLSFDDNALADWVADAGIDTDDAGVNTEINDLARIVDGATTSPMLPPAIAGQTGFVVSTTNTTTSGGAGIGATPTYEVLALGITGIVLLILWIGGIIWICMRRARLLTAGARVRPLGDHSPGL